MVMQISQWELEDRREGPRVYLQLKLALVYPQQAGRPARPMYQGKTTDLGMSGISLVVDYNIYQEGEIALVLALPVEYAGARRKVVTATAEMTYAIYSSKLGAYKIGLAFREFRGNGKALLEEVLLHAQKEQGITGVQKPGGRSAAHRPRDSQPLGG